MIKLLLTTTALVALSSVAVAGDIPAAPMAPVPAGFTVTATGDAIIYGYRTTSTGGTVTSGTGGNYQASVTAAKTLDNGADVSVELGFDSTSSDNLSVLVNYNSSLGNVAAGNLDIDDFDDQVPGIPGAPGLQDPDDVMQFADGLTGGWPTGGFGSSPVAIAFTSPDMGGFGFGLFMDSADNYHIGLGGSTSVGGATVAAGVAVTGTDFATLSTEGVVTGAVSVASNGFEVGASFLTDLGVPANDTIGFGASYTMAPFTVGADFDTLSELANVGVAYDADGYTAVLTTEYDVGESQVNSYGIGATAALGMATVNAAVTLVQAQTTPLVVAATMLTEVGVSATAGDATVGFTYSADSAAATSLVTAGVDYALNSNITVGAGMTYTDTGASTMAAGVVLSF